MLGLAIGCIGMTHEDFCLCTFGEFESICKAWREHTEGLSRNAWERTRTIATYILQPHVKKGTRLTPQKLMTFPWDKKSTLRDAVVPEMTDEEKRRRFEEVVARLATQS